MSEPEKIIKGVTVALRSFDKDAAVHQGLGYREPPRVDLELPVGVVDYYRVFPSPEVTDELREDIRANGVRDPIRIYTDGRRGVLRDGAHRLRIAYQLGIPTLATQIVPNFLGKVYDDYTVPVLEGVLTDWLAENLDYGHAEHRTIRWSVDKYVTKVSCSCGQAWTESPYEPWELVLGAHRKS
jgi:hypothetical protein